MTDWPLTCLMTTYRGTRAQHLRLALDSVYAQNHPAEAVLLVVDGPVSDDQDAVIREFESHQALRVVRLPNNVGSGKASNAGLELVDTPWVARMDADDIAFPDRFRRQLDALRQYEERGEPLAALGTAMIEFDSDRADAGDSPDECALGIRKLPCEPDAVRRYARVNSPINNPTVILRTAALREVGGYRHVPFMEDYDVYARLLGAGHRLANLPEPLLYFRASDAQLRRRTGRQLMRAERQMQRNLVRYGLISAPRAVANFAARTGFRLLPTTLLTRAYSALFRRKPHDEARASHGCDTQ